MYEARHVFEGLVGRRAYWQWTWHESSGWLIGMVVAFAVAIAGMFSSAFRLPSAFIAGALCVLLMAMIRPLVRTQADASLRGSVVVQFTDEGVSSSSSLGEIAVPWSAFSRAFLTRDFLFLVRPHRSPWYIPRDAISSEAVEFVLAKAQAGN